MRPALAQRASPAPFSGSYAPEDVVFLLKVVSIASTDVGEKERLIQSGARHYSEMVTREAPPPAAYLRLYEAALQAGAARLGREIAALAQALVRDVAGPITLASLVRAGVPLGVLLRRALAALWADVEHYGVSIIRDRGIDGNAIRAILARRPAAGVVFVDGWTGKGAIATELERSVAQFERLEARLVVLADPCGRAWLAASGEDWLIPSGILGCTVSGLISRSILNARLIGPGDFHGCAIWDHLAPYDRSVAFVERIWPEVLAQLPRTAPALWDDVDRKEQARASAAALDWVMRTCAVLDRNLVKPGIAEATRALLRRKPHRVFVDPAGGADLDALLHLADAAGICVEAAPAIAPYRAVTLIGTVA